jgi:hypothetical protein
MAMVIFFHRVTIILVENDLWKISGKYYSLFMVIFLLVLQYTKNNNLIVHIISF